MLYICNFSTKNITYLKSMMFFVILNDSKICEREESRGLNENYHGNAEHKLNVLCFVTDEKHSCKHSNAAAERRQDKQSLFGYSELNAILF